MTSATMKAAPPISQNPNSQDRPIRHSLFQIPAKSLAASLKRRAHRRNGIVYVYKQSLTLCISGEQMGTPDGFTFIYYDTGADTQILGKRFKTLVEAQTAAREYADARNAVLRS